MTVNDSLFIFDANIAINIFLFFQNFNKMVYAEQRK